MTIIKILDNKKNCTRSILFQNKVLFKWFRKRLLLQKINELSRSQQVFFSLSNAKKNEAQGFLRDIQQCQVHLLKVFNTFAQTNGVTYWLDFGTLIGAARSGRFIPWDDDIDISVPRNSFNTIWEKKDNLPKGFSFNYSKDKSLIRLSHADLPEQISLDIFPVDFISNSYSVSECLALTQKIHDTQRQTKKSNYNNAIKELKEKFLDITEELNESKMICYGLEFKHLSHPSILIPTTIIFPLKEIEFEGFLYPAPHDYSKHLTYLYKDWRRVDCSHAGHFSTNDFSVVDLLKITDYLGV